MAKSPPKIGPTSQRERFGKLDGRGVIAIRLKELRRELAGALGGWDQLSPQRRRLIEDTCQIIVRREMVWKMLVEAPGSVSREMEKHWLWLANTVRRNLQVLGLDKVEAAKGSRMRDVVEE